MLKKRGDELIATYNSKEEAEAGLHELAAAIVDKSMTKDYGVFVKSTQGVWGVWLRER